VQHLFQRKNQSIIENWGFDFFRPAGAIASKRFPNAFLLSRARAKNLKAWGH